MPDIVLSLTNPHDAAVAALFDFEIATQLDRQLDFKFSDLPYLMAGAAIAERRISARVGNYRACAAVARGATPARTVFE
jgi:hypothetical protein